MHRRGDRVLGPYGPDARGQWRIITIVAGKRQSTICSTRAEAEEAVSAGQDEVAQAEAMTIAEAVDLYLAHLEVKGDKPITVSLTKRTLARFFPEQDRALGDLTPVRAQKLYAALCARPTATGDPPAAATQQQALLQAKALLRWCCAEGLHRGPDPIAGIKPVGKLRHGKPQLRIDDGRLWTAAALGVAEREPGALAALLAIIMGLRAGEIAALRVADLDDGGTMLHVDGKTGRRDVEVPELLLDLLAHAVEGRPGHAPLIGRGPEVVGYWARKICQLAGIRPPRDEVHQFCAHSLRGMQASAAVRAGTSAHAAAAALGNSPRVLREAYATAGSEESATARRAALRLVPGGKGRSAHQSAIGQDSDPPVAVKRIQR